MMLALVNFIIISLTSVLWHSLISFVVFGATPIAKSSPILSIFVMITCTFCGIYGRLVIEYISQDRQFQSRQSLIIASIGAPIALLSVYNVANGITSWPLLAIVSYQNGFFFSNVLDLIEGKKATTKRSKKADK